jgi:hypothetical protein
MYYFVVSAMNSVGESANSTQASARPALAVPTNVTFGSNGSQLQFGWLADHTS